MRATNRRQGRDGLECASLFVMSLRCREGPQRIHNIRPDRFALNPKSQAPACCRRRASLWLNKEANPWTLDPRSTRAGGGAASRQCHRRSSLPSDLFACNSDRVVVAPRSLRDLGVRVSTVPSLASVVFPRHASDAGRLASCPLTEVAIACGPRRRWRPADLLSCDPVVAVWLRETANELSCNRLAKQGRNGGSTLLVWHMGEALDELLQGSVACVLLGR